jgi:hypothetical protein
MSKGIMVQKALDEMEKRLDHVSEIRTVGTNAVDVVGTIGEDTVRHTVYFDDGEIVFIGVK